MAIYTVAITITKKVDVEIEDELALKDFESARELAIQRGTQLVRSDNRPLNVADIIHHTCFLKSIKKQND